MPERLLRQRPAQVVGVSLRPRGRHCERWATHPGARGWNPERISSRMAFSCVSPSRRSRWTAEMSDTSAADSRRALRLVNVPTARPVSRPAARAMCGTSLGPNSCEPRRRVASGAAGAEAQQQQGGENAAGAGTHHHCRPQDDDDLCVANHHMAACPCHAPDARNWAPEGPTTLPDSPAALGEQAFAGAR